MSPCATWGSRGHGARGTIAAAMAVYRVVVAAVAVATFPPGVVAAAPYCSPFCCPCCPHGAPAAAPAAPAASAAAAAAAAAPAAAAPAAPCCCCCCCCCCPSAAPVVAAVAAADTHISSFHSCGPVVTAVALLQSVLVSAAGSRCLAEMGLPRVAWMPSSSHLSLAPPRSL